MRDVALVISIAITIGQAQFSNARILESSWDVTSVPIRHLLQTTANPASASCPLGFHSPLLQPAVCKAFNPSIPLNETLSTYTCFPCPLGTYKNSTGPGLCTWCGLGMTTMSVGAVSNSSCMGCSAGQVAAATFNTTQGFQGFGNAACVPCLPGQYAAPNTAISACLNCPALQTSPLGSSSVANCTVCTRGFVAVTNNNGTTCQPCPRGTFTLDLDAAASFSACSGVCPPGTTTPLPLGSVLQNSSAACTEICPAGTFSSYNATTRAQTCVPCGPGTYSLGGAGVCARCPDGSTTPANITSASTASACVLCPAGSTCLAASASPATPVCSACTLCQVKFYSTGGSIPCRPCPAGATAQLGQGSSPTCIACSAGSYPGPSGTCLPCPLGWWSVGGAGATPSDTCTQCDPGTTTLTSGATSASACTPCQPGTYALANGTTTPVPITCVATPQGTYSSAGAARPTPCTGYGSSSPGGSGPGSCTPCGAGTSPTQDAAGNLVCNPCVQGTYALAGAAFCSACPATLTTLGVGKTSLADCNVCVDAGQFFVAGAAGAAGTCSSCAAGTVHFASGTLPSAGTTTCNTNCGWSGGRYYDLTATSASVVCKPCPAGSYAAAYTAQPASGGTPFPTTCLPCSAGYTSIPGASAGAIASDCSGSAAGNAGFRQLVCMPGQVPSLSAINANPIRTRSCLPCSAGTFTAPDSTTAGPPSSAFAVPVASVVAGTVTTGTTTTPAPHTLASGDVVFFVAGGTAGTVSVSGGLLLGVPYYVTVATPGSSTFTLFDPVTASTASPPTGTVLSSAAATIAAGGTLSLYSGVLPSGVQFVGSATTCSACNPGLISVPGSLVGAAAPDCSVQQPLSGLPTPIGSAPSQAACPAGTLYDTSSATSRACSPCPRGTYSVPTATSTAITLQVSITAVAAFTPFVVSTVPYLHGYATGDAVVITTNTTFPAGLTPGVTYYVVKTGLYSFNLAVTNTLATAATPNLLRSAVTLAASSTPYSVVSRAAPSSSASMLGVLPLGTPVATATQCTACSPGYSSSGTGATAPDCTGGAAASSLTVHVCRPGQFYSQATSSPLLPSSCTACPGGSSSSVTAVNASALAAAIITSGTWTGVARSGSLYVPLPVASITASPSTPSLVVVSFASPHGFTANDPVVLSTTGMLPFGLSPSKTYFVVDATAGAAAYTTAGAAASTSILLNTDGAAILAGSLVGPANPLDSATCYPAPPLRPSVSLATGVLSASNHGLSSFQPIALHADFVPAAGSYAIPAGPLQQAGGSPAALGAGDTAFVSPEGRTSDAFSVLNVVDLTGGTFSAAPAMLIPLLQPPVPYTVTGVAADGTVSTSATLAVTTGQLLVFALAPLNLTLGPSLASFYPAASGTFTAYYAQAGTTAGTFKVVQQAVAPTAANPGTALTQAQLQGMLPVNNAVVYFGLPSSNTPQAYTIPTNTAISGTAETIAVPVDSTTPFPSILTAFTGIFQQAASTGSAAMPAGLSVGKLFHFIPASVTDRDGRTNALFATLRVYTTVPRMTSTGINTRVYPQGMPATATAAPAASSQPAYLSVTNMFVGGDPVTVHGPGVTASGLTPGKTYVVDPMGLTSSSLRLLDPALSMTPPGGVATATITTKVFSYTYVSSRGPVACTINPANNAILPVLGAALVTTVTAGQFVVFSVSPGASLTGALSAGVVYQVASGATATSFQVLRMTGATAAAAADTTTATALSGGSMTYTVFSSTQTPQGTGAPAIASVTAAGVITLTGHSLLGLDLISVDPALPGATGTMLSANTLYVVMPGTNTNTFMVMASAAIATASAATVYLTTPYGASTFPTDMSALSASSALATLRYRNPAGSSVAPLPAVLQGSPTTCEMLSGTSAAGVVAGTPYYVASPTNGSFSLAVAAAAGSPYLSSAPFGTHSVRRAVGLGYSATNVVTLRNHGLAAGDRVVLSAASGVLPGGLQPSTPYYATLTSNNLGLSVLPSTLAATTLRPIASAANGAIFTSPPLAIATGLTTDATPRLQVSIVGSVTLARGQAVAFFASTAGGAAPNPYGITLNQAYFISAVTSSGSFATLSLSTTFAGAMTTPISATVTLSGTHAVPLRMYSTGNGNVATPFLASAYNPSTDVITVPAGLGITLTNGQLVTISATAGTVPPGLPSISPPSPPNPAVVSAPFHITGLTQVPGVGTTFSLAVPAGTGTFGGAYNAGATQGLLAAVTVSSPIPFTATSGDTLVVASQATAFSGTDAVVLVEGGAGTSFPSGTVTSGAIYVVQSGTGTSLVLSSRTTPATAVTIGGTASGLLYRLTFAATNFQSTASIAQNSQKDITYNPTTITNLAAGDAVILHPTTNSMVPFAGSTATITASTIQQGVMYLVASVSATSFTISYMDGTPVSWTIQASALNNIHVRRIPAASLYPFTGLGGRVNSLTLTPSTTTTALLGNLATTAFLPYTAGVAPTSAESGTVGAQNLWGQPLMFAFPLDPAAAPNVVGLAPFGRGVGMVDLSPRGGALGVVGLSYLGVDATAATTTSNAQAVTATTTSGQLVNGDWVVFYGSVATSLNAGKVYMVSDLTLTSFRVVDPALGTYVNPTATTMSASIYKLVFDTGGQDGPATISTSSTNAISVTSCTNLATANDLVFVSVAGGGSFPMGLLTGTPYAVAACSGTSLTLRQLDGATAVTWTAPLAQVTLYVRRVAAATSTVPYSAATPTSSVLSLGLLGGVVGAAQQTTTTLAGKLAFPYLPASAYTPAVASQTVSQLYALAGADATDLTKVALVPLTTPPYLVAAVSPITGALIKVTNPTAATASVNGITTATLTTASSHSLAVGDWVIFSATNTPSVLTAGVLYMVLTVPSATTFTLATLATASPATTSVALTPTYASAVDMFKVDTNAAIPCTINTATDTIAVTTATAFAAGDIVFVYGDYVAGLTDLDSNILPYVVDVSSVGASITSLKLRQADGFTPKTWTAPNALRNVYVRRFASASQFAFSTASPVTNTLTLSSNDFTSLTTAVTLSNLNVIPVRRANPGTSLTSSRAATIFSLPTSPTSPNIPLVAWTAGGTGGSATTPNSPVPWPGGSAAKLTLPTTATATVTSSTTNTITTNTQSPPLVAGDWVVFAASPVPPANIVAGTVYMVLSASLSTTALQVALLTGTNTPIAVSGGAGALIYKVDASPVAGSIISTSTLTVPSSSSIAAGDFVFVYSGNFNGLTDTSANTVPYVVAIATTAASTTTLKLAQADGITAKAWTPSSGSVYVRRLPVATTNMVDFTTDSAAASSAGVLTLTTPSATFSTLSTVVSSNIAVVIPFKRGNPATPLVSTADPWQIYGILPGTTAAKVALAPWYAALPATAVLAPSSIPVSISTSFALSTVQPAIKWPAIAAPSPSTAPPLPQTASVDSTALARLYPLQGLREGATVFFEGTTTWPSTLPAGVVPGTAYVAAGHTADSDGKRVFNLARQVGVDLYTQEAGDSAVNVNPLITAAVASLVSIAPDASATPANACKVTRTVAHGLRGGDMVTFSLPNYAGTVMGTMPAGLTADTVLYYVLPVTADANSFYISATSGGSAVTCTAGAASVSVYTTFSMPLQTATACSVCNAGYTSTLSASPTAYPNYGSVTATCAADSVASYTSSIATARTCVAFEFSSTSAGSQPATTCRPCAPGQITAVSAVGMPVTATSCSACPTATGVTVLTPSWGSGVYSWTFGTAAPSCQACPAGSYLRTSPAPINGVSATTCYPCPQGSYSTAANVAVCTRCPAGQTTASAGTSTAACAACPAGSAQVVQPLPYTLTAAGVAVNPPDDTFATACTACPDGTFPAAGGTTCTACPPGMATTSGVSGSATQCSACPANTYAVPGATTVCTLCPQGFTSPQNSTTCTPCPAGSTTAPVPTVPTSACTPCQQGSYASNTTSSSVTTVTCMACPLGTYADAASQTSCKPCPAGQTTQNVASTSLAACAACPSGQYLNNATMTCAACPSGYFSVGGTYCALCGGYDTAGAVGSASAAGCSRACSALALGTAVNTSFAFALRQPNVPALGFSCATCPQGSYTLTAANLSPACTPCTTAGTTTSAASTNLAAAASGSTSDTGICTACPAGQFLQQQPNGNQVCTRCNMGYISAAAGATACTKCTVGTSSNPNNTACTPCQAGTFALDNATHVVCTNCPLGSWSAASAQVCSPCSAGFTTAPTAANFSTAASACVACPNGTYSLSSPVNFSATPALTCPPCPSGCWSNTGLNAGNANATAGAGPLTCAPCGMGKVSTPGSATSNATCAFCPRGQFSTTGSATALVNNVTTPVLFTPVTCSACPSGTFSNLDGVPGPLTTGSNSAFTTTTYVTDSSSLLVTYPPVPANSGLAIPQYNGNYSSCCMACVPGTFSSLGQTACTPCAAGTYSNYGAPACTPCPGGSFSGTSSGAFLGSCQICAADTFSPVVGGATACTPCTGVLSSTPNSTVCVQGTVRVISVTLSGVSLDQLNNNATLRAAVVNTLVTTTATRLSIPARFVTVSFRAAAAAAAPTGRHLLQAPSVQADISVSVPVSLSADQQSAAAASVAAINNANSADSSAFTNALNSGGLNSLGLSASPVGVTRPPPPPPLSVPGPKSEDIAWIAGPIVGGVLGVAVVVGVVIFIRKRKQRAAQTVVPKPEGQP